MCESEQENDIIMYFADEVKRGVVNPQITDLDDQNAKHQFDNYINSILKFNPQEYKASSFSVIPYQTFIKLIIYILRHIFVNINIDNELKEFFSTISITYSDEILNGIVLTYLDENNHFQHLTKLPNIDTTGGIVTFIHEFIHFHLAKIDMDYNKKAFYREILSIYAEKVALHILASLNVEPNIMRKIEETRLESIVWHYKVHPNEVNLTIQNYYQAKQHSQIRSFQEYINKAEETIPWIKHPQTIEYAKQYKSNLAAGYGLGYLYAESLLQYYIANDIGAQARIGQVLKGELKLQSLLDYYNINAANEQLYDNVSLKLNALRPKH